MQRYRGDRTKAALARKAEIDPSEWSLYERGKRMPGPDKQLRIARVFGLTVEGLEELAWEERRQRLERGRSSQAGELDEPPESYPAHPGGAERKVRELMAVVAEKLAEAILLGKS